MARPRKTRTEKSKPSFSLRARLRDWRNPKFLRVAVQTMVVSVIAYWIGLTLSGWAYPAAGIIGALWCVMIGIRVIQDTRDETRREAARQVLGALVGAITSGIYLLLLPFSFIGMGVSIGLTVFLCQVIGLSGSTKISATSAATIMVISSAHPELNPVLNATMRFAEACIGATVAMGVVFLTPSGKYKS